MANMKTVAKGQVNNEGTILLFKKTLIGKLLTKIVLPFMGALNRYARRFVLVILPSLVYVTYNFFRRLLRKKEVIIDITADGFEPLIVPVDDVAPLSKLAQAENAYYAVMNVTTVAQRLEIHNLISKVATLLKDDAALIGFLEEHAADKVEPKKFIAKLEELLLSLKEGRKS